MPVEIKVPSPGESITQVQLVKWLIADGDSVEKDQEIVEIDSDKASFPIASPNDGIIKILIREGETIAVGTVIATVEPTSGKVKSATEKKAEPVPVPPVPVAAREVPVTPLAEKLLQENKVTKQEVAAFSGEKRITRKDIERYLKSGKGKEIMGLQPSRETERKKLSTLRLKVAERLVSVKNETAMLTTFNEVNMQPFFDLKGKYNDEFKQKYGVGVGLMSFFTKAVTLAMKDFPQVNSMIDGDEQILFHYADIGIAVSAPKGLVVPVIRNAESLTLPEIELKIKELALKARESRITIDEMQGGTFTISNGGVFGSLMSTPILNPPQSAILGLHKIMDRPMAIGGKVEIRPMMYLALSYDHRIIDGRESVGFLVKIREYVEDPLKMLTEGEDPIKILLQL
jgi:2-oxoglutarate dehydrogenase E2 component (dihydrolipoamide succinyltransferase)